MDLTLNCATAHCSANTQREITVEMSGVSEPDVLDQFNAEDVVSHFPLKDLLKNIDVDDAKEFYGIE